MAEHKDKYAYLRDKTTEELNRLLQLAVDPTGEDEDGAYVDALLEVLAEREYAPERRAAETDRAWRAFQSAYNTEEGRGLSLYPDEPPQDAKTDDVVPLAASRRKRRALILAAVIACLLTLGMPAALGYQGFFDMIGQWSNETFFFLNQPSASSAARAASLSPSSDGETYGSIQDMLAACGITEPVAPTYIPEGFELQEYDLIDEPERDHRYFYTFYKNGGRTLTIAISQGAFSRGFITYEKDDTPVESYDSNGVTYYLFQNIDDHLAVWDHNGFECHIGGDVSKEELKAMIDSIYEN